MRFTTRLLLLFLLCLTLGQSVYAQPNTQTFGRSRIQYKNFDWKLYSTQNFNIYFYAGGDQAARNAAEYAERELRRITSFVGYYPYSKITIIVYNSVTDLKQSNIGLQRDQFQTGGETLFLKNKLELAFDGTQTDYKRDLSYQLTELLLNDMMYGGSLKEALQSSYLLRLPDWFVSGVAAYTAEGWSLRMDNFVRDMLQVNAKPRLEDMFARDQELAGQAIWNYIAERYGYTSIQNILNLTRITRDIEVGITSSLNIPYKRFLQDAHNYYLQINTRSENPLVSLPSDRKLFQKNKKDIRYTEPVLNPAGTLLAYAENENGSYQIIVRDVRSNRSRVVWKSGYKTVDQRVDYKLPVLAWRSNSQLGFVEARRGQMTLRQINASRRRSRIPMFDDLRTAATTLSQFSQVRDMSYSEDGSSIVVSAVRDGQTDLYLLTSSGRMQQQLTSDIYDDIHPVFLKGSGTIAFSSNRFVDTTSADSEATFGSVVNNYDIFLLPRDGVSGSAQQITFSIASETRPRATDDGNLVFLSEETGVRSLYRYDLATGAKNPISNFIQDIESYDFKGSTNTLALTAIDNAASFVYLFPEFSATVPDSLPKTSRQIILETRARNPVSAATAGNRKLLEGATRKKTQRQGEVDIENYQFESDQKEQEQQQEAAAKKPAAPRTRTTEGGVPIAGPVDYDLRFSVQEVITSVYADPQLGFGLVGGVNMSDLFENHHIKGSAFLRTDLETSRMFAEYMNLKNRFDIGMQYRRDVIVGEVQEVPGSVVRFGKHEFSPTLVYPLSYSTSIRMQPKFVNTRFTYVNSFVTPDSVTNFGGGQIEFVFDNSVVRGVNMLEGSRMKAGILSLKSFGNSAGNFNKFYVDLRHYQKVHRQIILAGRIGYGAFFGNAPKNFLIGGMDNWLFASEDDPTDRNAVTVRSPADLFYMEYATPLRGFNFNTRRGFKYLLGNLELRVPIVQYLYNAPIPSGFFRNLQLTAFADAGSAYNGSNPFTGNNSINTRVIGGRINQTSTNPFEITVINYRNPFLLGYGFGARTTLFGVYGKVDMAWSEEDNSRKGPKFYVTLGYDF
ncbi:WD-40-like repeat-containing protein [Pontibacter roseus]|uniref:WD-40-like repeat-containing protein n=1 Tax=Pontibacter roseus TaxID=336989 RepID=UPI000523FD93|nr:WD-40-like repeat-containing protein [Pontibacter roseus]